jgi:hypothetical protein
MKTTKWTDQQFTDAVASSTSVSQVLTQLGLKPAGGNYQTVRTTVERLNLSTDHWKGQAWNKGLSNPVSVRPTTDYLVLNGPAIKSYRLRDRLLRERILLNKCSECGIGSIWRTKNLRHHLDHINGNHFDNRLENLRLLCPNCHSQTDTYCGRNIGAYKQST